MDPIDNAAILARAAEAHDLVERLKKEIFGGEEKKITGRIVHKLLFYFLITLMVGSTLGMFYMNWQMNNRLAMAKRTGIIALSDGSMFELTPVAPKNQVSVAMQK